MLWILKYQQQFPDGYVIANYYYTLISYISNVYFIAI